MTTQEDYFGGAANIAVALRQRDEAFAKGLKRRKAATWYQQGQFDREDGMPLIWGWCYPKQYWDGWRAASLAEHKRREGLWAMQEAEGSR